MIAVNTAEYFHQIGGDSGEPAIAGPHVVEHNGKLALSALFQVAVFLSIRIEK